MANPVIHFFVESPFMQRDYERFGVETLARRGFAVKVWDFSPFLSPAQFKHYPSLNEASGMEIRSFRSEPEAVSRIAELDSRDVVVNQVSHSFSRRAIQQALSRSQATLVEVRLTALPSLPSSGSWRQRLLGLVRSDRPIHKLLNAIYNRIPRRYSAIRPPDLLLLGGTSISSGHSLQGNKPEPIWCHALDYDLYLKSGTTTLRGTEGTKIVFLDEYYPFHPDYAHLNTRPAIGAGAYYPLMCRLFQRVETELTGKVVVAAHPRSKYEEHPDYFEGREVIRGGTVELVRSADLVIAHSSTALNFAVLYGKPVLFVTLDEFRDRIEGKYIELMASLLGKKAIPAHRYAEIDLPRELKIDPVAYANYKERFIKKKDSPDRPTWEIFADHIQRRIH